MKGDKEMGLLQMGRGPSDQDEGKGSGNKQDKTWMYQNQIISMHVNIIFHKYKIRLKISVRRKMETS